MQQYDDEADAKDDEDETEEDKELREWRRQHKLKENSPDIIIRDPLVTEYQQDMRKFVFDAETRELRCLDDRVPKTYIVARRKYDIAKKCFYTEYTRDESDLKDFCARRKRLQLFVLLAASVYSFVASIIGLSHLLKVWQSMVAEG